MSGKSDQRRTQHKVQAERRDEGGGGSKQRGRQLTKAKINEDVNETRVAKMHMRPGMRRSTSGMEAAGSEWDDEGKAEQAGEKTKTESDERRGRRKREQRTTTRD